MKEKTERTVPEADGAEALPGEPVTANIRRGADGTYRWYYELPMLKNPVILFTTWKVLGVSFGVVWLVIVIASAVSDGLYGWRGFLDLTWGFILLTLALALLSVFAYLIVAWVYGWRYIVLFEMDDEAVRHIQVPRQFKKAQALAWMTLMVGVAAKQPTAAAAGLLAATRNTSTSELKNVERLVMCPRRDLIKVNQRLARNQVYAAPEDFEFVRDYLVAHCGKASVK